MSFVSAIDLLQDFLATITSEIISAISDPFVIAPVALLFVHAFLIVGYLAYMKKVSKRPWNLNTRYDYEPVTTIIVPAYRESKVIVKKLKNILELEYPPEKLQVIVIGDPETIEICREFIKANNINLYLIEEKERMGKSQALNYALKHAKGEVIATSDADAIWDRKALKNALYYLSDPSVAAVSGHEIICNHTRNIHTYAEQMYRDIYYILRLGESKMYSTMIFQGELAAYKRDAVKYFDSRPGYSDDTGTVIRLIREGYRCLYVPEAVFWDNAPPTVKDKVKLKSRRGQHLFSALTEAMKYKIKRALPLPSTIVLANFYMHILSPIIQLVALLFLLIALLIHYTVAAFVMFSIMLLIFIRSKKVRAIIELYSTSSIALVIALIKNLLGMKKSSWDKITSMRVL